MKGKSRGLICFLLFFLILQERGNAQVKIEKNGNTFQFVVNQKPYYVKGVGGETNLDYAVSIGANSIRTWGTENAQQVLDEAHKKGLTVLLGFWLQHERHGFDYNNDENVEKQTTFFKSIIDKFKNHPALLAWGLGNELNLHYSNPKCWDAVQVLAKYIHQVDPNHPTATITAGLDSLVTQEIMKRVPDLDIYCINTYGDIGKAVNNIEKYGWKGPFMITEWGVNGFWESPKTEWGVSIEQNSTEKKNLFYERFTKYIAPQPKCLGSYAFLWGHKQEYTETWFGLFNKDNQPTEAIDALEYVFTNKFPIAPAPTILSFKLNNQTASNNIYLAPNQSYTAEIVAKISTSIHTSVSDKKHKIVYSWKILAESTDKKSGGDREAEAEEIKGCIKKKSPDTIEIKTPREAGAYRLFVKATCNKKVAYSNIPFYVK